MPRFGELEAVIMERIWAADDGALVRDVVDDLRRDREIAYTTVQTVMEILRRKGWLHRASHCARLRPMVDPRWEREAWAGLLAELSLPTVM